MNYLVRGVLGTVLLFAGIVIGVAATEWWEGKVRSVGHSAIARTGGFARYADVAKCRPIGPRNWRAGFRRPYGCLETFYDDRWGHTSLHVNAFGEPVTAMTGFRTDSVTALAVADSIRTELRALGATPMTCPQIYPGIEIWRVGDHFANLGVQRLRVGATAVSLGAFVERPSRCT